MESVGVPRSLRFDHRHRADSGRHAYLQRAEHAQPTVAGRGPVPDQHWAGVLPVPRLDQALGRSRDEHGQRAQRGARGLVRCVQRGVNALPRGLDLYHVDHPYEDGGDSLLEEFPAEVGNLMVGAQNDSYFIPTNPFIKDQKGSAITTGRLTVTKMLLTFTKSSGFTAEATSKQVSVVSQHDITNVVTSIAETLTPTSNDTIFNGFVFGDPNAEIGKVPVTDGQQSIPIGRETREFDLVIRARSWVPLTVTALEWVGQFFNRSRRL